MHTKYIVVIVILIGGALLFSNLNNKTAEQSSDTIKIGAVISLTGPAASFGEYANKGMKLAAKEINEKGGIDGKKIVLVVEDDRTDPKDAVSAYKKVVSVDKAQGVIGGLWDFVAEPLLPLALQNETVFISPSNLRIEGSFEPNAQSFLMLTEFENVLRGAEPFLKRDDVRKIAVVHFKSGFGEEVARAFNVMTEELGKGPMINESYNELGNNDFKTLIAKLKQENVDTVFLDMVDIDTVNFLRRAKELNFNPKFITYVGSYDAFTDENKYLLEGITVLDWEFSKQEFVERYKKEYGAEPAKSAQRAYDAVYVLVEAIAKTDDNAEVAEYIESHSFTTPNGTVQFLPNHAVDATEVELRMYRDGKLVAW